MKKYLFFIIFIIIIIASIICGILVSNNNDVKNINVSLKYSGFSTESDFSIFNSAEKVYRNKKNGYNIIKIDCLIKNSLNKAINVTGAEPLNDNDFIIPDECIDIEPTFPINANTQLNVTMYVYAKENLTEEEIKERIKKVNINLVFYTEKGEKIVPDSYWSS